MARARPRCFAISPLGRTPAWLAQPATAVPEVAGSRGGALPRFGSWLDADVASATDPATPDLSRAALI
eukprot:8748128-Alexandrium_andersonii.AAC.1